MTPLIWLPLEPVKLSDYRGGWIPTISISFQTHVHTTLRTLLTRRFQGHLYLLQLVFIDEVTSIKNRWSTWCFIDDNGPKQATPPNGSHHLWIQGRQLLLNNASHSFSILSQLFFLQHLNNDTITREKGTEWLIFIQKFHTVQQPLCASYWSYPLPVPLYTARVHTYCAEEGHPLIYNTP